MTIIILDNETQSDDNTFRNIYINVYDLRSDISPEIHNVIDIPLSNSWTSIFGFGIFHSGVEIEGENIEYYFG
jgi:hypothetical protein